MLETVEAYRLLSLHNQLVELIELADDRLSLQTVSNPQKSYCKSQNHKPLFVSVENSRTADAPLTFIIRKFCSPSWNNSWIFLSSDSFWCSRKASLVLRRAYSRKLKAENCDD